MQNLFFLFGNPNVRGGGEGGRGGQAGWDKIPTLTKNHLRLLPSWWDANSGLVLHPGGRTGEICDMCVFSAHTTY